MDIVASPDNNESLGASDSSLSALISANLDALQSAHKSICELPPEKYNSVVTPYFDSCFGKHIRHILDHYLCFMRDFNADILDYEQRNRSSQLETDREYALMVIKQISEFFQDLLTAVQEDRPLKVLLCSHVGRPDGETAHSSIKRELQFLHGHAVHHYALISVMMKLHGVKVSPEFGVAPSTLAHQETVKVSA